MRVHELAKQLNISSKDLLASLHEAGHEIKGHMSSLDEQVAQQMLAQYSSDSSTPKSAENQPTQNISEPQEQEQKRKTKKVSRRIEAQDKEMLQKTSSRKKSKKEKIIEIDEDIDPNDMTEATLDTVEEDETEQLLRIKHAEPKKKSKKFGKKKKPSHIESEEEEQELSKDLYIGHEIQVKVLAEMMHTPAGSVITKLMEMGMMVNMTQNIDHETAGIIAHEFGFEVREEKPQPQTTEPEQNTVELENASDLVEKAPVVTFMGHVDHGKTSLLDYIRKSRVADHEAGKITQHIGAYEVTFEGKRIVFLDTPGHSAFTAMRARGANATDITVLVVAADDGIMTQTREAISHTQNANVPMIVAINKCDKATADPDRIYRQLSEMNLMPEAWGGEIITVNVSAHSGEGVEHLLEMILLQAEMMELKANPKASVKATVIESKLTRGRGPTVTVLVTRGTLRIGDPIICDCYSGKVKSLLNDRGHAIKEAGPATPVEVLGLDGVPDAGSVLEVVDSEKEAKRLADERTTALRKETLERTNKPTTLEDLYEQMEAEGAKELKIIIKGDVHGSIEALGQSLEDLSNQKVSINVIHKAVGDVSESDVMLATASDAIIIGFCIKVDKRARDLSKKEGVQIKTYSIIYEAIEEVQQAMTGMLGTRQVEEVIGQAVVREIFTISRIGTIAGCYVKDGKVTKNSRIRVIRNGELLFEGTINALKRFKDDAKEVRSGLECGINIDGFNDIEIDDTFEFFVYEQVAETM